MSNLPAPTCATCGAPLDPENSGQCPRCLMLAAMVPTAHSADDHREPPPPLETVQAAFPHLEVLEMIGQGGMGCVFKVRQPKLNRFAALKLLPQSLAADPAFAGRFEREAQLLAKLSHPNIVSVYDYGQAGGFFHLLMEYVEGVNLRQAMRASRFTPPQALGIVPKICEALQFAHDEGVLHRDIKPENILLDAKGRVKLVDFGIAKLAAEPDTIAAADGHAAPALTQAGAALGTPSYMAPEQRDSPSDVDHRADIYSLGVVFYELLTGELPTGAFAPPSAKSTADPRVDAIVQQALEKERTRRQRSAGEMKTQVETVTQAEEPPQAEHGAAARFSRTAVWAASWILLSTIVVPPFLMHESETHEFMRAGPFASVLMAFVWFVFLIPAFAAPLGATLLGWVSVTQIRRSAGQLHGLGLAVFDGLFFPLLALDAVIWFLCGVAIQLVLDSSVWNRETIPSLVREWAIAATFVVAPCVDFFIVRRVWRTVTLVSANARLAAAPAHIPNTPRAWIAFSCAALSGFLGTVVWLATTNSPRMLAFPILLLAVLAIVLAWPVRKSWAGRCAFVVALLNAGLWIFAATVSPYVTRVSMSATTAPEPADLFFGPVMERELTANPMLANAFLDLDTGKVLSAPKELVDSLRAKGWLGNGSPQASAVREWMRSSGADVIARVGVGRTGEPTDLLQVDGVSSMVGEKPSHPDGYTFDTATVELLTKSITRFGETLRLLETSEKQWGYDPRGVFSFKTREGRVGVLEILESKRGVVKVRFKLAQSVVTSKVDAGAKLATTDTAPTFGPVMERVLPSGEPCREEYFQFRSGGIFIVGNGPGTSADEAAYDEKRIEEAGGVDMSASSGAEGIQIVGRGCIFTLDLQDLKWDRFTAERAVEAIQRVSFVDGVVSPKKSELPITYLFKTARGEVGIMEVLGVVDDERDGWTAKGMKFRYKLVQGTGTTTTSAPAKSSLIFGPEIQGLQAALEVTSGEPFKLRIRIRNVSAHGISIDGASYRQEDECLLADAQDRPVPITRLTHDIKVGMKGGYYSPGQVAVFESAGLSFQSIDKAPPSAGYVAQAPPGRYTVRVRLRLPGDDVPFPPNRRVWHGELETGTVTIEVKDPATQPVVSVADSIWSSVLGPAVERTVNDLQTTHENCALSLDSGKLQPVPADITLDTLTNPAAHDAAIAWARDHQVDAIAFVTTNGDRIVRCGLLCPGLLVLRAENPKWDPDTADPRMLKDDFEKAMHDWNFIPPIAEVTTDDQFPANYLILDTRTHRRGVLQILGTSDQPRGVKIRYRLVEGVPVKKITPAERPSPPNPAGER